MLNCNSERIPRSLLLVSKRIKKLTEFLTVEDSLQLAAGFFNNCKDKWKNQEELFEA
jgi:hypothetical protein